jgi:hypothetical protein
MITPTKERSYLAKGWKLSEFTVFIPFEARDEFLEVVGNKNYAILSQQEVPEKRLWRAKLLISPEGIEILNLFLVPPAGNA